MEERNEMLNVEIEETPVDVVEETSKNNNLLLVAGVAAVIGGVIFTKKVIMPKLKAVMQQCKNVEAVKAEDGYIDVDNADISELENDPE